MTKAQITHPVPLWNDIKITMKKSDKFVNNCIIIFYNKYE